MGFGSAFTSAWNKASDAVKDKVAQVATTAKQVVNKAVDKTQSVVEKAKDASQQAQEKAKFIAQQAAKTVDNAKKAVNAAKTVVKNAVEKAKPIVKKAAEDAKQKAITAAKQAVNKAEDAANKAINKVQQKAVSLAKKAKDAYREIKNGFDVLRKAMYPAEPCPVAAPDISQSLYHRGEVLRSSSGRAKAEGEVAAYKYEDASSDAAVFYAKGGIDGARVGAEAAALKAAKTFSIGEGVNPMLRTDVELRAAGAEAKGDFLVGYDARRVGVALGGSLGAEAVKAGVKVERNIQIPFTNWSISVRGAADGVVKGVGIAGGAHGYYDKDEKRVHVGAFGEVAAALGLGFDLDISIGERYTSKERKVDF